MFNTLVVGISGCADRTVQSTLRSFATEDGRDVATMGFLGTKPTDATGVEVGFHDGALEEMAERAAQAQPVEAGQNACHRVAESFKKSRRDAGECGRSW